MDNRSKSQIKPESQEVITHVEIAQKISKETGGYAFQFELTCCQKIKKLLYYVSLLEKMR